MLIGLSKLGATVHLGVELTSPEVLGLNRDGRFQNNYEDTGEAETWVGL